MMLLFHVVSVFFLSLIVLYSLLSSRLSYRVLFPSTIWHNKVTTTRAQPQRERCLEEHGSLHLLHLPFSTYPETPSAICTPVGCGRIHASASGHKTLVSVLEPRHREEAREAILTEIFHEKLRWLGWHMR